MAKLPPAHTLNRKNGDGDAGEADRSELDDLAHFCAKVEIEEMQFEHWQHLHQSLDLHIFLKVSTRESEQPGTKSIEFVRSITLSDRTKGTKSSRIRVCTSVSWDLPLEHEQVFILAGQGDQKDEQAGDARITVRISDQ